MKRGEVCQASEGREDTQQGCRSLQRAQVDLNRSLKAKQMCGGSIAEKCLKLRKNFVDKVRFVETLEVSY